MTVPPLAASPVTSPGPKIVAPCPNGLLYYYGQGLVESINFELSGKCPEQINLAKTKPIMSAYIVSRKCSTPNRSNRRDRQSVLKYRGRPCTVSVITANSFPDHLGPCTFVDPYSWPNGQLIWLTIDTRNQYDPL